MRFPIVCTHVFATLAFTVTAVAQQDCAEHTARAHGQVLDGTGAAIAGASVTLPGSAALKTDSDGRFTTACLSEGAHHANVQAPSFEPLTLILHAGESSRTAVI